MERILVNVQKGTKARTIMIINTSEKVHMATKMPIVSKPGRPISTSGLKTIAKVQQKRVATAAPGSNKSSRKDYKNNCRIAKTCDKDVAKNNHRSVLFADDTRVLSIIFL